MNRYKVAVITVSDRSSRGEREDLAGPLLVELMEEANYQVVETHIVADEMDELVEVMTELSDRDELALILTTGGTGFSPRDITPEATMQVAERLTPGIPEAMRAYSSKYTNRAYLSRAQAGIRKRCLIVNLPGSPKALKENLEAIIEFLDHGLLMLRGASADCANE